MTGTPAAPDEVERFVTAGGGTVNVIALLIPLAFVTTTLPVLASVGTDVPILPSVQLETVALAPLKVTVPVGEPK